ncbi:aldo/keto reductase [uncultured Draconibacterium sp.]|uniref:aldo/keto reductase n=1 Tax=uncultured Draconibacterium sp. TaxID=1573823 RepID=UPI0029C87A13|nr:aldo/keto reductase [uncultured Draconibacterium sp.]
MENNLKRKLGHSGIEVSAMGMGCWAIGGRTNLQSLPLGWGKVDDAESIRALEKGIEMGINFIDTADVYGAGHSEKLISQVLKGRRDKLVIATKFGIGYNPKTSEAIMGLKVTPEYTRKALESSLARLKTDYIDLYQLHVANLNLEAAGLIRDTLEDLVQEGKIRGYGWSTDDEERATFFADGDNCIAVQHELNVFVGNKKILKLCKDRKLASINRGPLAMGVLTGKYNDQSIVSEDDCRSIIHLLGDEYYMFFEDGKPKASLLKELEAIGELLRSDGRTLAQGALSWIWAKNKRTIPIPGFKTVKQVEENAGALKFGPLTESQMAEIKAILKKELVH